MRKLQAYERDNQPRTISQRAVQQNGLRCGLLHQYGYEQGHRSCADRIQTVQDGLLQFLFSSEGKRFPAAELPQDRIA